MIKNIEQIKSASDIVDLIEHYQPVSKNGANFISICPFHSEKTPSLSISQKKQLFYCFGCNKGGDIFKFVEMIEHCEFTEAVRKVASICKIDVIETKQECKFDKSKLYSVFSIVNDFAREELEKNVEAKEYLASRKIYDSDFDRFLVGYLPNNRAIVERLEKFGLVSFAEQANFLKNGYCNMENRISFAITQNDRIVGFSARTLSSDKNIAKYINSATSPIFEKKHCLYMLDRARKSKSKQILLLEGIVDVISANKLGFDNAVATCGTALSASHISLLTKNKDKDVVIAYDNDKAGYNATVRAIEMFLQYGIYNICACKMKTKLKDFGEHLQNGVDVEFEILCGFEYMLKRQIHLAQDVKSRQEVKNRFVKILEAMPESASEYRKLFASILKANDMSSDIARVKACATGDIVLELQKYLINLFSEDTAKKDMFFGSKYFEFLNLPLVNDVESWDKTILDPNIRDVTFYTDEFNSILIHLIRQGCQNALNVAVQNKDITEVIRIQKILKEVSW